MRTPWRDGRDGSTQFWTDDPKVASTYTHGDAPNMMRGRLRLGRSLDIDAGGGGWDGLPLERIPDEQLQRILRDMAALDGRAAPTATTNRITHAAKDAGYDSVVFRNVRDEYEIDKDTPLSTVYAILQPHNARLRHAKFKDLSSGDILGALGVAAPTGLLAALQARRDSQT